jgi:non-specific serine/threonine protein kinase/serine/threonine-protein kinase
MISDRWQQIKTVFHAALEREPGEREAFLDQACHDDVELRREVESLLASHDEASGFIEMPALAVAPTLLTASQPQSADSRRIGPYQIIREIGRGGMGSVYLAVRADDQFRKRVAIKLIRRGMDSDDILRRFRNERQILAALDHPNIARLLDGGTTDDGLPYFAMEYIEGQSLTDYCDTRKLNTIERLKLFRAVCAAVHYAHQNLIVHRDLKPGNILVTADGMPKLLDFGIAKLLNPEMGSQTIAPTATMIRLMTPDYASPEQVRGETITTASDVYALGVILYELLTGHHPYRIAMSTPQDIERVVCEQEPERPSQVKGKSEKEKGKSSIGESLLPFTFYLFPSAAKRLWGDLDNIVLMAMHKEPQRRYASAERLAEDIRRHLDGLPVIARPDTFGYRAGKFIRRNKLAVTAAALILLTLLGGVIATLWQARVAHAERAKAERRFNEVRALANSFMFEFHDAIKDLPGATKARELVVKRALEYLDRLAKESGYDPLLQRELATAYEKVGEVQGSPQVANLGDTAGALQSYQKSLALREALAAANPNDPQTRRELAISHDNVGDLLARSGKLDEALQSHRQSLAIFQSLVAQDPNDARARRGLAVSYGRVANVKARMKDFKGALENHRNALAIRRAFVEQNPHDALSRRTLAVSLGRTADMLAATGNHAEAEEHYRQALDLFESLAAQDRNNATARRDVSIAYERMAEMLAEAGDMTKALAEYQKSLAIAESLAQADPSNAQARVDLASSYSTVGDVHARLKDYHQARTFYRRGLSVVVDLQARGLLSEADKNLPDELNRKIAQCDAALKKQ